MVIHTTEKLGMEDFLDYQKLFFDQLQKLLTGRANYQEWKACARMLTITSRRLVNAALREGTADPELLDGVAGAIQRAAQEMGENVEAQGDADVATYREHTTQRESFFRQRSALARSSEKAAARYL